MHNSVTVNKPESYLENVTLVHDGLEQVLDGNACIEFLTLNDKPQRDLNITK